MLLHDPVEDTKEYAEAMKEIQPILDALPDWVMLGGIWECKREELEKRGIIWKNPKEMNPDVHID